MESDRIALKMLAIATAGVIGIEAAALIVVGRGWLGPLVGTGLARLGDIAWMGLIVSRSPPGWAQMGLERASWRAGLLKGLIWSAGFGAVALLGCAVLHALKIDPLQLLPPARPARPPTLALLFLVAGLIAPMAEEFYFRGLIYGYCRRWGFWPALGVSTLIFTLLHTGVAAFPLTQLIGGLVFATAYEIEKKLMVPITIHVLGNLALFGLAYV